MNHRRLAEEKKIVKCGRPRAGMFLQGGVGRGQMLTPPSKPITLVHGRLTARSDLLPWIAGVEKYTDILFVTYSPGLLCLNSHTHQRNFPLFLHLSFSFSYPFHSAVTVYLLLPHFHLVFTINFIFWTFPSFQFLWATSICLFFYLFNLYDPFHFFTLSFMHWHSNFIIIPLLAVSLGYFTFLLLTYSFYSPFTVWILIIKPSSPWNCWHH